VQQLVSAGRAGALAAEAVAKSSPDGYTLLYGTTAMMTITPYVRKVGYDPLALDPVARVATLTTLVAVNKDFPAKTFADFVTAAKKNPGKFTYASSGEGTLLHLIGESLQSSLGIKLLHVPYKGMAPAVTDFLSGQINVFLEPVVLSHIQAGRGTALAVIGDKRLQEIPATPTMKELGIPFTATAWFGIFVPKGTQRAAVDRLAAAINTVASRAEFAGKLPPAVFPAFQTAEQFAKTIDTDRNMYRATIKQLNLKLD
jgi:tripartite-type tricarboxylate transporter receptor subunit TctC